MVSAPLKSTSRLPEQGRIWELSYRWLLGTAAARDEAFVEECVALYSREYGIWGPRARKPGRPVQLKPSQFRSLIDDEVIGIACAYHGSELIGYCVAAQIEVPELGRLAWVSQLVVHVSYRRERVATRLLYSIWQFSDCYAWGLVTANPFAVRALETATRRPCRATLIEAKADEILPQVAKHVSYVPSSLVAEGGRSRPRVNTKFFVSHEQIPAMRKKAARGERPWDLGKLAEGEEWFACTFRSQPPMLADSRLSDLLAGADDIWLQAYEGMTLDEKHLWHTHTDKEVAELLELSPVDSNARILDVGCGDGRHVTALSERGHSVVGIEISPRLLANAWSRTPSRSQLELMDARKQLPSGPFDLVLCLYDVLGSSVSAEDDWLILRNIARVLAPGGRLIASVMNACSTLERLAPNHRPGSIGDFILALEQLSPSSTMEQTGAVFDPKLILYFQGAFYRKEQFRGDEGHLPAELVVRDRRFAPGNARQLFEAAGFDVLELRPVQAGHWTRSPVLDAADPRAKELLIVAEPVPAA